MTLLVILAILLLTILTAIGTVALVLWWRHRRTRRQPINRPYLASYYSRLEENNRKRGRGEDATDVLPRADDE